MIKILPFALLFAVACQSPESAASYPAGNTMGLTAADQSQRWNKETPVGTVVAERPAAARVFDLAGIDYCCGGDATLGAAALEHGVEVGVLLSALHAVGVQPNDPANRSWTMHTHVHLENNVLAPKAKTLLTP